MEMECERPRPASRQHGLPAVPHKPFEARISKPAASLHSKGGTSHEDPVMAPSRPAVKDAAMPSQVVSHDSRGLAKPAPDALRSRFDKMTKLSSIPTLSRRRFYQNPEESTGPLMIECREGCFWSLKGPAVDAVAALQQEIDDCLWHANLGKTVYRSYYMYGKSAKKASPVIILWGADRAVRKSAKQQLKEEKILEQQKYEGWSIRLAQHDPIFQTCIPLMDDGSPTDCYNQFDTDTLSFWRNNFTGGHVVCNSGIGQNATAALCGPITIMDETFYFTSAHVFTGISPFDGQEMLQEHKPPAQSENLFDSSDDESDVDSTQSTSDCDPRLARNGSQHTVSKQNRDQRQSSQYKREKMDVSDPGGFNRTTWPTDKVFVRLGLPGLDYALIRTTSIGFSLGSQDVFAGFDWYLPKGGHNHPPTTEVTIWNSHRHVLRGSLLPTSVSCNLPGKSSVVHFWVYWPNSHPLDQTDNKFNGVRAGDSGAWVYGDDKIYGHVVAGNPATGAAFVVPSYAVYHDIDANVGTPHLPKANFDSEPVRLKSLNTIDQDEFGDLIGLEDTPDDLRGSPKKGNFAQVADQHFSNAGLHASPPLSSHETLIGARLAAETVPTAAEQLLLGHKADLITAATPDEVQALQPRAPSTVATGEQQSSQLSIGADMDVRELHDNALQAASYEGHAGVAALLLNHGANVNLQGSQYGNALQAASLKGHTGIVKLLLEYGADIRARGGIYGDALQAASFNGHVDIVALLIDCGADVNAQGGRYRNALQAASSMGHLEIVRRLLENGANVNAQADRSDTVYTMLPGIRKIEDPLLSYEKRGKESQPASNSSRKSQEVLGDDQDSLLRRLIQSADDSQDLGQFTEAVRLRQQVLETQCKVLGEDHLSTVVSMAQLASTYEDQGRWEQAEHMRAKAIGAIRRTHGEKIALLLNNSTSLVSALRELQQWTDAWAAKARKKNAAEGKQPV